MKRFFSLVICMALLLPSGLGDVSADQAQYTISSEISPLSSALHVLPPIGENTGDVNDFDETLAAHLKVSIWQAVGENDYVLKAEFTSDKLHKGLDYIKLQGNQYHVNWDISKGDIGKSFLIYFVIRADTSDFKDLNIGYITYLPKTGRTIPIKFRIDNHPSIRARLLNEQGLNAAEVAFALADEFQTGAGEIAQILTDEGYNFLEIGEVMRDVFGLNPQEAAQMLTNTDSYSAQEIAQILTEVFELGDDALMVSQILKNVGYTASQIMYVLKESFGSETGEIVDILNAIGFTSEELFAATSRELAEMFAPQLRFDQSAWTFPMSAQEYFENAIETPGGRLENTDPSTLTTPGTEPPTYFKAFKVGNQIRILYWWYYGYQPGCVTDPFSLTKEGIHDGDWERVVVILSEDLSKVVAVTYYQHTGYYTRLANGGDTDRFLGADYSPGLGFDNGHPIVYVGKVQHGSYHNQGGWGDSSTGFSFCDYFADWRNNGGNSQLWLNTQNNLKSLADFDEAWMLEEASVSSSMIGIGDGAKTVFDLDSKFVIAGSVKVKVNDVEFGNIEFGNTTGNDGVDQVKFLVAPESGAIITASWDKGDFKWGCGPCEDGGISTHPIKSSTTEAMSTLHACSGMSETMLSDAGCFESQCEYHDNQTGWTPAYPGTCSHCPSGYTDMGFYCGKGTWPWEWSTTSIHYYGLDYPLSQDDRGLSKTR